MTLPVGNLNSNKTDPGQLQKTYTKNPNRIELHQCVHVRVHVQYKHDVTTCLQERTGWHPIVSPALR